MIYSKYYFYPGIFYIVITIRNIYRIGYIGGISTFAPHVDLPPVPFASSFFIFARE